jgi:copper chaperone CopZ
MKVKLVWGIVLATLLLALSAVAAVKTSTFKVEGMKTDADVLKVRNALKPLPGIQDFAADPKTQLMMLKYDSGRSGVIDIADALDTAGYTLSPFEGTGVGTTVTQQESEKKAREVLTDFSVVLGQTRDAVQKEKFGLARSLALALKVRRDAVVTFEKSQVPAKTKQPVDSPYTLALALSKAVDEFGAAAEVKDKAQVQARLPNVKQAFKALSDARKYDDLLAPPEPQTKQEENKSLQQQLEDKVKGWIGK